MTVSFLDRSRVLADFSARLSCTIAYHVIYCIHSFRGFRLHDPTVVETSWLPVLWNRKNLETGWLLRNSNIRLLWFFIFVFCRRWGCHLSDLVGLPLLRFICVVHVLFFFYVFLLELELQPSRCFYFARILQILVIFSYFFVGFVVFLNIF